MRTTRPFDLHCAPLHRARASLFRRRLLSFTVTPTPRRRVALGYPTPHASWPLDAGNPYARCISSPRLDSSRTSLSSVGGTSLQDPHAARIFLRMLLPVVADLRRLAEGFWNRADAERMGRGGDEDERVRCTGVRAPTPLSCHLSAGGKSMFRGRSESAEPVGCTFIAGHESLHLPRALRPLRHRNWLPPLLARLLPLAQRVLPRPNHGRRRSVMLQLTLQARTRAFVVRM
ncbi:hypothetical protein B0H14DRAFT_33474 [Mycena olivaceomarginata]|nr:hypothetical protein B0H14DRAFT_33474 [Mycena olivaceomarginata]